MEKAYTKNFNNNAKKFFTITTRTFKFLNFRIFNLTLMVKHNTTQTTKLMTSKDRSDVNDFFLYK